MSKLNNADIIFEFYYLFLDGFYTTTTVHYWSDQIRMCETGIESVNIPSYQKFDHTMLPGLSWGGEIQYTTSFLEITTNLFKHTFYFGDNNIRIVLPDFSKILIFHKSIYFLSFLYLISRIEVREGNIFHPYTVRVDSLKNI